MFHDEVEGVGLHKLGYYGAGDPGAVGAYMAWIDTSMGLGHYILKIRNAANTGWEILEQDAIAHVHVEADITDLGTYLDETAADLLYAALSHTHVEADITDLETYLTEPAADLLYEPLGGGGGSYDPEAIPRMQIGSNQAHVSVIHGIAVDVYALPFPYTGYARICARDFIRFIRGGTANLLYKLEILGWTDNGGGTPSMVYSADPTSPLDLDSDLDVNVGSQFGMRVWVKDGDTGDETFTESYFILQDNQGVYTP